MAEAPRFKRLNWKALLLCLLAAVIFWFFSALNKESTTDIRFPVQVLFDEARFIPTQTPPDYLLINVTGTGWDLLATEIGWRHDPLRVTLERPDRTSFLLTRDLLKDLTVALGGSRLNFIHGDTLHLNFDLISVRKMKLRFNPASVSFREGFGITGPVILRPETINVIGPARMLHDFGNTIEISAGDRKLSRTFEEQIEVFPKQSLLSANPQNIDITIPVGRVSILSFRIPVELDASDKRWRTVETESRITIQMPEEQVDRFDSTSVYLQLQVRKPAADRFFMFGLVKGLPAGASLLKSDSIEVYRSGK